MEQRKTHSRDYITVMTVEAVRLVCQIGSDRLLIGFGLLRSFPKVDSISGGLGNGNKDQTVEA